MLFTQMKQQKHDYKQRGRLLRGIATHATIVLSGWFHVIEKGTDTYITCNTEDLNACLGKMKVEELPLKVPELFDVPFYYEDADMTIEFMKNGILRAVKIDKTPPPF